MTFLNESIETAKEEIASYESDTFSASHNKLTPEEIELMLAHLIERKMQQIDGLELLMALDLIRSDSL